MSNVVISRKDAQALFMALGFKTANDWDDARLSKKLNDLSAVADEDTLATLGTGPERTTADDVLAWNAAGDTIMVGDDDGNVADETVVEVAADKAKKAEKAKKVEKAKKAKKAADKAPKPKALSMQPAKPAKAPEKPKKATKPAKAKKAKPAKKAPEKAAEKPKKPKKAKPAKPAKPAKGKKAKKGKPGRKKGQGYGPRDSGVIAEIWKVLCKASSKKPITKDEVLLHLQKTFPERSILSMATTVNAQIPRRICSLRKGTIYATGDGGYDAGFWVKPDKGE